MNTRDILRVDDFKVVVALLNDEFEAHDFIATYSSVYAAKYVALLRICRGNLTIVDAQIAIFLRDFASELDITRVNDDSGNHVVAESENIKTNSSDNSCWRKL